MQRIINTPLALMLVLFSSMNLSRVYAQAGSGEQASKEKFINPAKLRSYLRQPNGIEKLSVEVGDVTFNEDDERWGEHTLNTLTKNSDFVVVATVRGHSSRLTDDGDSISTEYRLQPQETLKGTPARDIEVTVRGGKVTLSNGHFATLHTTLWDGLKIGHKYIFFLKKEGNSLVTVGASQGILQLNESTDVVSVLDNAPHDLKIQDEVRGTSIASIENAIHNAALPD